MSCTPEFHRELNSKYCSSCGELINQSIDNSTTMDFNNIVNTGNINYSVVDNSVNTVNNMSTSYYNRDKYIASNFKQDFVKEITDKRIHVVTWVSFVADALSIFGVFCTSFDGYAKFWLVIIMIISSVVFLSAMGVPSKNPEEFHSLKSASLISKLSGLGDRKRIGYWFKRVNDKILFFKLWSKCPTCHNIGLDNDCYLGISDSLTGERKQKSDGSLGELIQEEQWICCFNKEHRFAFDKAIFGLQK